MDYIIKNKAHWDSLLTPQVIYDGQNVSYFVGVDPFQTETMTYNTFIWVRTASNNYQLIKNEE